MLAFTFCLAIFSLWTAGGFALLRVLDPTRNRLQSLLLAPPVGLILTVIVVFFVSRFGVPVKSFAPAVTLAVALLGAWGVWRDARRPAGQPGEGANATYALLRRYAPFAGTLLVAAVLSGRPLFEYGFDWLSYCNDDMANYTLAAERFLHHGFYELPPVANLADGTDYSQNFWFMHARDGQRPGCELLVAWAAGTSGLSVHAVYMPLILAMHVGLVSVATAGVYRARRRYRTAVWACALMAASALSTFGAMYQLVAQVSGLGILALGVVLLLRPLHTMRRNVVLRYGLLVGVLGAGFLIVYPEASPFLALSFLLYHGIATFRRRGRVAWKRLGTIVAVALVVSAVAMQTYVVNAFFFLLDQTKTGQANTDVQVKLFPFYMLPSGPANLWNLQAVAGLSYEPLLSVAIGCGIVLTAFVLIVGVRQAWRGEAVAVVTILMFAVAFQLFYSRSAFGLYKLAMFLQPFMLGVVAIALARRRGPWPWARVACLALLVYFGARTQWFYVTESRGAGGFAEIRDASEMRITSVFDRTVKQLAPRSLLIDSSNITLAKYQSVYTDGIPTAFPTHDFFANIQKVDLGERLRTGRVVEWSEQLLDAVQDRKARADFDLKRHPADLVGDRTANFGIGPKGNEAYIPFIYSTVARTSDVPSDHNYLVAAGGSVTILNRAHNPPDKSKPFVVTPMGDVRNHLIFKFSELGIPYFGGLEDDDRVTYFQVEHDTMIEGGRFIGIGRYLLFEVINPTPNARMLINLTTTLKADGVNQLPPAAAVGATREAFPMLGRGAARVYSPPLATQLLGGRHYVVLDCGQFGTFFPFHRRGLMRLWGDGVMYDHRKLVAFARDISMVSDDEYRALKPPASLTTFPRDLLNTNLEYSGIYERDGWVSDASYYMLDPAGATTVAARGEVPLVNDDQKFTTLATLLLDGKVIAEKTLPFGSFELAGAVPPAQGRRRVELRFSHTQALPDPDNRPAGAKLSFIGFETPVAR